MHITGTDSKETRDYFELINKKVEELYVRSLKKFDAR